MATDISHLGGTLDQIRQLNEAISSLEERREALKQTIIDALGEDTVGTVDDVTVVSYRTTTTNIFDSRRFREQNPDVAAHYMRTNSYRSLRFVEPTQ